MKKYCFFIGCLFMLSLQAVAQTDYKVVFDCTSKDTMSHKAVIRWIKGITEATPNAQIQVVFYAQSLGMITKDKSVVAPDIEKLLGNKNVSFTVCEAAMKNHQITKDQLLPGVRTVPDGIYEIITKQKEGWGYIKASL